MRLAVNKVMVGYLGRMREHIRGRERASSAAAHERQQMKRASGFDEEVAAVARLTAQVLAGRLDLPAEMRRRHAMASADRRRATMSASPVPMIASA
jgi:hypothetical protein